MCVASERNKRLDRSQPMLGNVNAGYERDRGPVFRIILRTETQLSSSVLRKRLRPLISDTQAVMKRNISGVKGVEHEPSAAACLLSC